MMGRRTRFRPVYLSFNSKYIFWFWCTKPNFMTFTVQKYDNSKESSWKLYLIKSHVSSVVLKIAELQKWALTTQNYYHSKTYRELFCICFKCIFYLQYFWQLTSRRKVVSSRTVAIACVLRTWINLWLRPLVIIGDLFQRPARYRRRITFRVTAAIIRSPKGGDFR